VSQELWDQVQQCFADRRGAFITKKARQASDALLAGKLFDDSGNRMSPSWASKGSKRWRYYVSQAALRGDKSKTGSIVRVPAAVLEALVGGAVGKHSLGCAVSQADIRELIDRVTIVRTAIQVQLSQAVEFAEADGARSLTLPWTPPSPYRKREIIQGVADWKTSARPMRSNARAILLGALREAHRWLDELVSDPLQTSQSLALREGKTSRLRAMDPLCALISE
jgi:site-specific DNA recombinase